MLRWLFMIVHLVFGGYLIGAGIAAYRLPDAALGAGITAIFCALWFFFAAVGFFLRHVWFVTIASMALAGLSGLYLFLAAVDLHARGGGGDLLPWASPRAALGLVAFLLAGVIYSVFSAHLRGKRQENGRSTFLMM